tara:strand:+ start:798 stop:1253 length:456 start_codon:yes stop_codon:yes gene_type:complete
LGAIHTYIPTGLINNANLIANFGPTNLNILTSYVGILLFFVSNILLFLVNRNYRKDIKLNNLKKIKIAQGDKEKRKNGSGAGSESSKNSSEISITRLRVSELEEILKDSRQSIFNLLLDPNSINSPDDLQSALDSLEQGLVCLKKGSEALN